MLNAVEFFHFVVVVVVVFFLGGGGGVHTDFACYFTSTNFLFCFSLFSILKFSLFNYVEIKIIKEL